MLGLIDKLKEGLMLELNDGLIEGLIDTLGLTEGEIDGLNEGLDDGPGAAFISAAA